MPKKKVYPWDHPRFRSWVAIGRACQAMNQTLTREITDFGIKLPHLDILVNLYRFEGLTQQELARKLLVGRSNMSMLLPQMEKRGLLIRMGDASDKRVLRLFLTEEGREITEKAMEVQTRVIDEVLLIATDDECSRIADVMENLTSRLLDDNKN